MIGASDPEGNAFSVNFFTFNGIEYATRFAINLNPITVAGIGTFNMIGLGAFGFTPAANFHGIVPISFRTIDTLGAESTSTLTITVQSINDNPVAPQVNVSTNEDTPLSGDVLPGDFRDVDGDIVTVAGYTFDGVPRLAGASAITSKGTFVLNGDGTYTFTPAANFNGIVNVTFAVTDGVGGGDSSGKLTITVNPINDNPVIPDTTASIAEDNTLTGNVIPTGYRDADGDAVVVGNYRVAGANVGVTNVGNTLTITQDVRDASGVIINTITVGTLIIQQDGSYTFIPEDNFNGPVPLIIVTFADGHGGFDEALLKITVAPVNDAPTNLDLPEAPTVNENVLGALIGAFNLVDPDKGDTFTYEIINQTTNQIDPRFIVQGNQIFLKGTEFLNYEAENADSNPIISLILKVTDSAGASVSQSFSITVIDQNDPLTVVNDSVIQNQDTGDVTGNVLDNDFDEDGVAVTTLLAQLSLPFTGKNGIFVPGFFVDGVHGTYTGTLANLLSATVVNGLEVFFPGITPTLQNTTVTSVFKFGETTSIPGVGIFTMDDDGTYTFTPEAGFVGQVPTIHYGVLSLAPGTATGIEALLDPSLAPTLNITINATGNQPPTANPDTNSGDEDAGNITGNVIVDSDTDPDGDTLFVTKFNVSFGSAINVPLGGSISFVIPDADNSVFTLHSNGDYTFEPAPNFFTQLGEPIQIEYTISDGKGGTATSTLEITVNPVNDAPVDHDDVFSVAAGEGFKGNLITGGGTPANNGKDIDIDGDALTVASFMIGSTILTPGQVFTQDNGETSLSIDSFGNVSGILAPGSSGFPAISYIISDGHGGSSSASVTVQAIV